MNIHETSKNKNISINKFIVVVPSLSIFLSVLFNFIYFHEIGEDFFKLFTIEDHITSSFQVMLYISPLYILIGFVAVERMLWLEKLQEPRGKPIAFLGGSLLISLLLLSKREEESNIIILKCFLALWIALLPFCNDALRVYKNINQDIRTAIVAIPPLIALTIIFSLTSVSKDKTKTPNYELTMLSDSYISTKKVTVIRSLEKGLIVYLNKQLYYFTWDHIISINYKRITETIDVPKPTI